MRKIKFPELNGALFSGGFPKFSKQLKCQAFVSSKIQRTNIKRVFLNVFFFFSSTFLFEILFNKCLKNDAYAGVKRIKRWLEVTIGVVNDPN